MPITPGPPERVVTNPILISQPLDLRTWEEQKYKETLDQLAIRLKASTQWEQLISDQEPEQLSHKEKKSQSTRFVIRESLQALNSFISTHGSLTYKQEYHHVLSMLRSILNSPEYNSLVASSVSCAEITAINSFIEI